MRHTTDAFLAATIPEVRALLFGAPVSVPHTVIAGGPFMAAYFLFRIRCPLRFLADGFFSSVGLILCITCENVPLSSHILTTPHALHRA